MSGLLKIRMSVGKKPLVGYVNIDPVPQVEVDKQKEFDIRPIDFRKIEQATFDAESNEVFLDGCLDYVKRADLTNFIMLCVSKLRKNGVIHLIGTDLLVLNRMLFNGQISEEDFNKAAFGVGNHPWSFKNGLSNLNTIVEILQNLQLKITNLSYNGAEYNVSARRI